MCKKMGTTQVKCNHELCVNCNEFKMSNDCRQMTLLVNVPTLGTYFLLLNIKLFTYYKLNM